MDTVTEVRTSLVEMGGRISLDFGLGRIFGQVLVYLYFNEQACSLDKLCNDLELSKASISIAARQLESLGLVRRHWKKGDRKNYYSTADNIATALQQGLLSFIRQKMNTVAVELAEMDTVIEAHSNTSDANKELQFLATRIKRTQVLQKRAATIIDNPVVNLFIKTDKHAAMEK